MEQPWLVGAYRVGFGLLTLVAIGYQFVHGTATNDAFRPGNFFSFFTIESNIFAAIVLLVFAFRGRRQPNSQTADLIRGAAVLYMATTGIVYGLLLSGYTDELQTATPWVNNVVHRIMPVVLVVDWLLMPPATRLTVRRALIWLAYPIVYLIYSLIRGPVVDWYPYPFLNPDHAGGYAGVALYSVGIAICVVALTWVLVWLGRHVRLSRR